MNNNWLIKKKEGLYCIPGDFYIDPIYPVNSALITHSPLTMPDLEIRKF